MPTITEVYQRYPITKGLRVHQLRVAAVATTICDGFDRPLDRDGVIRACLIHDLGNLIKFDLNTLPELLEPEGREYWEHQKRDMIKKYSSDEHEATVQIVRELGVSEKIIGYIEAVGFKNTLEALANPSYEAKICHYADHRVTPHGVTSLADRLADGTKRYAHRTDLPSLSRNRAETLREASFEIERQIFEHVSFQPGHITDESIAPQLATLADFEF